MCQFKGLAPKNKGHMNFERCCDLTIFDDNQIYFWVPEQNFSSIEGKLIFAKKKLCDLTENLPYITMISQHH